MDRKPHPGSGSRGGPASGRSRSASQPRASQPRSARPPQGRPPQDRYGRSQQDMRRSPGPAPRYDARQAPRKRRKTRTLKDLLPLLLLLAALAAVIWFIGSAWFTVKVNESTYCANVSVNGVELDQFSKEEGVVVVNQVLSNRLNETFTLSSGDKSWSFKPADFDAEINADSYLARAWNIGHVGGMLDKKETIKNLKSTPVSFNAPVEYNAELIDAFLEPIYDALYVAPIDAQVTLASDRPYLTGESSLGQELDTEAARQMICTLIETGTGETELPLLPIEPAVSSDTAEGGLSVIVEYSTDTTFRRTAARKNISKALGYFNAFAVYPGDTVDFNEVVGPRTELRGFFPAAEYVGNTSQEGIGGGVCQASSTLYGAMMLAGMDIIERSNHSMTVSYVDPSLDAVVTDTGFKNLIFRNSTDHAIYIYTSVDRETATVTVYGNRPDYRYELESRIVTQDAECSYVSYIPDEDGKYCYYTNETKLHTEGHPALQSEGWIVAYDWETGEMVKRSQLSFDIYESGTNIYWRGIHDPTTGEVVDYDDW